MQSEQSHFLAALCVASTLNIGCAWTRQVRPGLNLGAVGEVQLRKDPQNDTQAYQGFIVLEMTTRLTRSVAALRNFNTHLRILEDHPVCMNRDVCRYFLLEETRALRVWDEE